MDPTERDRQARIGTLLPRARQVMRRSLDRPTQLPCGKEPPVPFAPTCHARRPRRRGLRLLIIGLALAVGGVRPLAAQDATREAVLAANQRFVRAEALRDPDSLRAVFWPDAVLQPANGRRFEGHDAILGFYARRARASRASGVSPEPADPAPTPSDPPIGNTQPTAPEGLVISPAGSMAVIWGPGESGTYYYNFLTILERRDAEWKVLVNSWNIRPAPATAPAAEPPGRSN